MQRVKNKSNNWVNKDCFGSKPFSVETNFSNWAKIGTRCISKGKISNLIENSLFTDKNNILNKWKVCTSIGASSSYLAEPKGQLFSFIMKPGEICTNTYIVVNTFDDKKSSENFISYMRTKFFRFMLSLRVLTQIISKEKFSWVPDVEDYTAKWTDKELYKKYDLTTDEIAYIESKIKTL